jgi:glycosyltransferase involved in cell wall biosynthesis
MSGADKLPVSVVIPAYNRPEMTLRAVESALGQRPLPPAEVIVVDDCSTDDTGRVAADAGARVIRHERNQGEGASRNTGVAAAEQPWIGLLDSDDEWLPGLLATLWPLREGRVLVAGAAMWRGPGPDEMRYAGPVGWRARTLRSPTALVYPENFLPASGVLVRADVLRSVGGYNPALKFGADLDLWLRVLRHGTGVMSPTVVVNYYVHAGQVTQDRDAMAASQLEVLRSYADGALWPRTLIEAWRGVAAWDRFRRQLRARQWGEAARAAGFFARHPVRLGGVGGMLVRRQLRRRRTARLRASGAVR